MLFFLLLSMFLLHSLNDEGKPMLSKNRRMNFLNKFYQNLLLQKLLCGHFFFRILFFTIGWHFFTAFSTTSTQYIFLFSFFLATILETQPIPPPRSTPTPFRLSQKIFSFFKILSISLGFTSLYKSTIFLKPFLAIFLQDDCLNYNHLF